MYNIICTVRYTSLFVVSQVMTLGKLFALPLSQSSIIWHWPRSITLHYI